MFEREGVFFLRRSETVRLVFSAYVRTLDERVGAPNADIVRVRHIADMRVVGFEAGESCVGKRDREREFDAFIGESGGKWSWW